MNNNINDRDEYLRQKAINAERARVEKIKRARQRKALLDKADAIGMFGVIGAVVCVAVIFVLIFFDFRSYNKAQGTSISIYENDSKKELDFSDDAYLYRNGTAYVSLSKICEKFPLTLHGNVQSMTLSTKEGDYAVFEIGKSDVNLCGTYALLSSPSYFEGGELFIPVSFFRDFCNGCEVIYSSGLSGKGVKLKISDSFGIKNVRWNESEGIPYSSVAHNFEGPKPEFKADLSDYEMYMNPENRDEYLVLINQTHPLSSDYIANDLTDIRDTRKDSRATQQMRLYAAKSLEALFIEMRANGYNDVSVTSGYRSYAYQKQLFDNQVKLFGGDVEQASKAVAVPGTSEHQSGLCIDMHNLSSASQAFSQQEAFKWLYSNCAKFGFILRFPKDKTEITGIMYEPWHYRYVGRYHAQKIMGEGICLEEYMTRFED